MLDNFLNICNPICIQIFSSFGLYTLLFLITRVFNKQPILAEIDKKSCDFTAFIGIFYLLLFFIWIAKTLAINDENKEALINRMFGIYWFGFWLQPFVWFGLSQLVRIQKIRNNVLFRIIVSVLFILSFEKITIILTSLHRDYLPSSWTMYQENVFLPSTFWLAIIVKIIEFFLFVFIFSYLKELKYNKLKLNTKN